VAGAAYVVLDKDVSSFLFKQDNRAEPYRPHLTGKTLCLSFQTVAELRHWGQARRDKLAEWLLSFVILPYDNQIALAWARIRAERRRQGRPISAEDAWIAACALRHTCPLITHNAGDYTHIAHLIVLTEAGV